MLDLDAVRSREDVMGQTYAEAFSWCDLNGERAALGETVHFAGPRWHASPLFVSGTWRPSPAPWEVQ